MTTKQVLEDALVFLGKEDLLSCSYFTESNEPISSDDQKELDMILRCLNLIVDEISTDYLPIYKQTQVEFVNNEIDISDISNNIFQIVKIQNLNGESVKFKVYGNKINAKVKTAVITYSVYADKCTLDGQVENFGGIMPQRVLAYGTAMEYSFISSLYDDATIWENRYKNSLLAISSKQHNIVMPKRRWL